jgi:predicted dehydrogenase
VAIIRFGIIGTGNMGGTHAGLLLNHKVARAELRALCDIDPARLTRYPQLRGFSRAEDLIDSELVDAVLIATPHYSHTTVGIAALRRGLHVLVEKPLSAHKADCQRLIAAHTNPLQKFAAMFNQRTDPFYRKIREMARGGELGEIRRVNWIITNWFRTEAYYASGGWRATWAGEGGGVLLNQCPHNLDLFQWMFGMPGRVRAFCGIGRHHQIEVEDDVTAYMEFPNGATAVFITSTGDAPGTNRLEITADRGKLVYENDSLLFTRNEVPTTEFSRTSPKFFDTPPRTEIKLPVQGHGGQHLEVLQNFVDAVLDGAPLIAPAEEGIHSVELANAMLLSSFKNRTVELPMDAAEYAGLLEDLVRSSTAGKKEVRARSAEDFSKSFNH